MFTAGPLILGALLGASAFAQTQVSLRALPNGVEATRGESRLQVTALRDGVLRVRQAASGEFSADTSWAVLPAAQKSSLRVTPTSDGFKTSNVRIAVGDDLRLSIYDPAGKLLQQDAEPARFDGTRFRVYKRKEGDDHFFGLGDKPGPLDHAGQSYVMWNSDTFGWQESTDPIYKSIPFFMEFRAGRALGVLFDNTWRTFFDFGHELPDEYSFGSVAGPIDYYLLVGPDPKQVVEEYAWLTGPTPLPPLWSLGFQQSRYSYETETRLNEVAARLRTDRIPADALYIDIDYQFKNRPFTVNDQTFPNFAAMVKNLAAEHFHLVAITDLHIADLPGQGYAPYDSGLAGDHFVKKPDGSIYVGQVWPGASVFPDFTRQQTRTWWGTLYKQFVADGVAGFWNDMNEPAIFSYPTKTMPDDVQHRIDEPGFARRTATHLEIHNVFGMENARATYDGVLALRPNERPFVLTRAAYAGTQRYAATWTGDNSSTWNHLRMTTPQLLNLGLSGFSMSGADVGGFAGSPPPDLLTKWLELAAFQPIDRDHAVKGSRDHEPWADGVEQEAVRRHFIEERYRLMPYLYTAAEETSRNGMPIVRPLFLEFPRATSDGHPLDLDASGEFLFGANLLVAPNPSPEEVAPYEVHLPPGIWYDYWTGERFVQTRQTGSQDLEQRDNLAKQKPLMIVPTVKDLPVFARGGSILPMAPLTQSTEETPAGPLTLRVYVGAAGAAGAVGTAGEPCAGEIYQDDGHTFNFRKGQYLRERFSCRLAADGSLTVSVAAREGTYRPWWTALHLEIYGWNASSRTAMVGTRKFNLQQSGPISQVDVPDNAKGFELLLR